MTCGLVHASYSLPKWQAVKLTFFNLHPEFINSALFLIYFIIFLKLVIIVKQWKWRYKSNVIIIIYCCYYYYLEKLQCC